jgi:DNA-binding XRE family transcriptional regulator
MKMDNFKLIRNVLKKTQAEMAEDLGLSRQTIVNMENKDEDVSRTMELAILGLLTIEINKEKDDNKKQILTNIMNLVYEF